MLTFQDQIEICQEESGDYSAARLVKFKRDINQGGKVFINKLGRKFNREYKKSNLKANQQYYQFSADILRIATIKVLDGTTYTQPTLVDSEEDWNNLNNASATSTVPTHMYIRGVNEVGFYPIPSDDVAFGIQASYNPQQIDLSQNDFTTGTVTVTNGSQVVDHSLTGFTEQMVGRWLNITDGTDGRWYRIGSFSSSSRLILENFYEGVGGSGRTFRIGEVMKIPDGYQDAPVAYALRRYYKSQTNPREADNQWKYFLAQLKDCRQTYARSTAKAASSTKTKDVRSRTPFTNLNARITYP